jgi:hypothetical protein
MDKVPVIVMRNKTNAERYLASSIDVGDWDDENLDVAMEDIQHAYMIVRKDLQPVSQQDYEAHVNAELDHKKQMIERFGDSAFISLDFDDVLAAYEPVNIEITQEQYQIAKELMEE